VASPLGHTAVALALGVALQPAQAPRRYWVLGVCCCLLPDLDFLGRWPGNRRLEALLDGHRGLTHSIPFAFLVGLLVVLTACVGPEWRGRRGRLWAYFTAATASHGLVDCLTAYGASVALLAPISWVRVKAPWQPLSQDRVTASSIASPRNRAARCSGSSCPPCSWRVRSPGGGGASRNFDTHHAAP